MGNIKEYKIARWKKELSEMIFPLVVQALYNAKVTLGREYLGTWWKVGIDELEETYHDVDMLIRCLRKLGIHPCYVPSDREDKGLTHVSEVSVQNILEDFTWEKLKYNKFLENYTQNRAQHIAKLRTEDLEKRCSDKWKIYWEEWFKKQNLEREEFLKKQYERIEKENEKLKKERKALNEEKQMFYAAKIPEPVKPKPGSPYPLPNSKSQKELKRLKRKFHLAVRIDKL